ncbi:MAG TPA: sulfatase [Clostridia bacterium]|nr:sulfatase [Clostridia bacterium]
MTKPNIVFILIDDMGWRDLSCCGSDFYETPNIDRLAREGMRFERAYAACPVCSPTRASLLTGKYPARVGVTDWIGAHTAGKLIDAPYADHLPLSECSLAEALRQGGYRTWHVGKWHLGEAPYAPEKQGFDINIGGCHWGAPWHGYFSPYQHPNLPDGPEGEYLTDRITSEAVTLIEGSDDKPFFLNLWHYAVHTPIQAPADLIAKYAAKAKRLGLVPEDALQTGEAFPCAHKKHLRVTRRVVQSDPAYAAMVENLDTNVGRILEALERCGKLDNTLILFSSDNGGLSTAEGSPTCNLPLSEGKGWMYEGGVREPLLARWHGRVAPGTISAVQVTSPDLYPTLLEAAGLALRPDQHVDGQSFLPALQGKAYARAPMFWHYPHYGNQGGTPGSSVVDGDWKLIRFWEDGADELYHLPDDPSELRDLAEQEPERVQALRALLDAWLADVAANIPQENPDYAPWPDRGSGRHKPEAAPWL